MKISSKTSRKKSTILIGIIIFILIGSYFAVAYFKPLWPFSDTTTSPQSGSQQVTDQNNQVDNNSDSPIDKEPSTEKPRSDGGQPNYVDTPITKPDNNASFPIENARWRIDQTTPTSYEITLFAIANNATQYGGYTDQLRVFKKEALIYLSDRYGDTSKFTFKWSPSDAANL